MIQQRTPGSGKKRAPSPPGPRSGSVFNLEEVIASIESRDEQRRQSDSLSNSRRASLPPSESIPKKDRYRVAGAASPLLAPGSQSVASPNNLPARTPVAEVDPRAKRQSTRWAPSPASGTDTLSKFKGPAVAGGSSSKTRASSKVATVATPVRGSPSGTRGGRTDNSAEAGARHSLSGGASPRTPKYSRRARAKSKRSRKRGNSSSSNSASSSSSSGSSRYSNGSSGSESERSSGSSRRGSSSNRGRSHSRSASRSASTHRRSDHHSSRSGGSGGSGGSGVRAGERRSSSRDRHGSRSISRHNSRNSSYSGSSGGRIETTRGDDRTRGSSRGDRSKKVGGICRDSIDSRRRHGERDNSRERESNRTSKSSSRPRGGERDSQAAGKRVEQGKSLTSGSSSDQVEKRRSGSRDPRRGVDKSRDRSGHGGSKDHDQPDPYTRDRRGERNRNKSSDRRDRGRDVDKDVDRARSKTYGGGDRYQDTPSRRSDDDRRAESPVSGSGRSKPSSPVRARRTPTKGPGFITEGSPAVAIDRSATRGRRAQGDATPLAGNGLSSAYDHLPMPTSSIEFHSSMGGDGLFSSLEDQLYDQDIRGGDTAVGSKARPSISSAATSPHPAPVAKTPVAATTDPDAAGPVSSSASSPSGTAITARPERANIAGVSDMSKDDGGNSLAGSDKTPSKKGNAPKETTDRELQNPSSSTPASTPPAPPPLPPPPPPSTSVSDELATATTVAAEGVAAPVSSSVSTASPRGQSTAQTPASPTFAPGGSAVINVAADESTSAEAAIAAAAAASGTAASTTVPEAGEASQKDHPASSIGEGGTAAEDTASLGTSAVADEPAGTDGVGVEQGGGATDREEVAAAGWERTRRDEDTQTGDGSEVRGWFESGSEMGSPRIARGQVEGNARGDGSIGEDGMPDLMRTPTQSKSRRRTGGSPWYKKGTSVVLNCAPGVKPGTPSPSVALADLVDRPVRHTSAVFFLTHTAPVLLCVFLLRFCRYSSAP